jgi:hypothetical protein
MRHDAWLTSQVKLAPLGGNHIADPRSGESKQSVGQSHAGGDSGYFSTTMDVAQLRKGKERGMVNDIRRLL